MRGNAHMFFIQIYLSAGGKQQEGNDQKVKYYSQVGGFLQK